MDNAVPHPIINIVGIFMVQTMYALTDVTVERDHTYKPFERYTQLSFLLKLDFTKLRKITSL